MATEDISTLQIKVRSDGITDSTNKLNKLAEAADKAEQATKKLGTNVITASMSGATGATTALTTAILMLSSNITTLTSNTTRNTTSVRANAEAMKDAHAAARGLSGSLGALWMTYGSPLPLAAGLAIGASIKNIVSSGREVENTIEAMRVKGGESIESANKLREAILSIGQGVYGPQEVAKALDTLILAGLTAEQAMGGLKASLNLATAGGTGIENAAEALVTIGTAVGATSDQYDMLADGITKAANTSLASVDSIAQTVKRASVVNKLYGATFEDILVQASALANLGIKNSAAGTAITNFYGDAIGKTEQAKKALDALKFSFFDAAGKAKPLVEAFEELNGKMQKFDQGQQKQFIKDIFGERAMRDVVGIVDMVNRAADDTGKYANKLREVQGEIQNMAGTAALAAVQLSLTTDAQLKSVKNTLESTFVKVFKDMEPQINVVAMRLKAAFGSPEFAAGVTAMASAVASLTVFLVENVSTLAAVAEGMLAVKIISMGGALFGGMIPLVNGLAVAFGAVTVSTTGAAAATGLFGRAILLLPGIGLALGALAAVVALVTLNTGKMKDQAQETAEAYNTNYLGALKDEAERLEKTNELMGKGQSLRDAELNSTKELALAKAQANNQSAIGIAMAEVINLGTKAGDPTVSPQARVRAAKEQEAAIVRLNAVRAASDKFDKDAGTLAQRVIDASEAKRQAYLAEQKAQEDAAAKAAGTVTIPKVDKEAEKYLNFLNSERLELERLMATYKARTDAINAGAANDVRVMAEVQQARVRANADAGKYSSQAVVDAQLRLAAEVDVAKFEKDKAEAITENHNKLAEIVARERAFQEDATNTAQRQLGMMEKKTAAVLAYNDAGDDMIKAERALAAEADETLRREAARQKLITATGSSRQRADGLIDEADAMMAYGRGAKQTAVELAKAEISKHALTDAGSKLANQQRLEAAGLEDIARAYNNIAKLTAGLNERELLESAASRDGVIGAETAKVAAHYAATEAIMESNRLRAESGLAAAKEGGNTKAIDEAQATYDKMVELSQKAGIQIAKNLKLDIKIAGLKDVANMFGTLSTAANKFGEKFEHVGKAFAGLEVGFNRLAEANAREGLSDAQRTQERIGSYGEMAGAAASFFQEGSKGYNTLMGVSKVFHAAEMAMGVVRLAQLAIGAVLTQGMGDPYTAFARMAAMAAIVAGLGFAVGGGFNSSKGGKSAADMQKEQGTGSVFGDAEAKSESILKSMEILKANSDTSLPISQDMLKSLRNIEASMVGLTNLVVRTPGITDGSNMGIQTGKIAGAGNGMNAFQNTLMGTNALGGGASGAALGMMIAGPIGAAIGAVLGGTVGKALGKLWGSTKQNIVDSGLSFGGKVSDLQNGEGFNQYASIDTTKKSAFGLKKKTSNRVEFEGLNDELSSQFGLIFTNLETTLTLAATALGKEGSAVSKAINDMVIDTTSVSLKGLKGQELQDALNSVISKTMDQIAEGAFPAMGAFRQVGEGYAQTVVRVATGVEQAQVALKGFGITAIAYTDIINKTGDVGYELVQQSIALKEAGSGVGAVIANVVGSVSELAAAYKELITMRAQMESMNLGSGLSADTINGAGGAKELSSALSSYYEKFFSDTERAAIEAAKLTKEFGGLGYALPSSRDQLRSWVEAAAKAGDQTTVGGLLKLADAFAELGEQAGSMVPTIESMLDTAMQNLTRAVEAEKKRQEKLYKEQTEAAKKSYEATMTGLKAKAEADKAYVKAQSDTIKEQVKETQKVMTALAAAVKATAPMLSQAEAYANAMRTAKGGLQAVASGKSLGGITGLEDAVKELAKPSEAMYSSLIDYQRGQAEANVVLDSLERAGTKQLSDAEKTLLALEAINTSNERAIEAEELRYKEEQEKLEERHQARMDALDKTLEMAQAQIDVLLGIDTSIQTMAQALANFQMAVGNAAATKANGAPNATAAIESLYKNLLGRKSDAAGLKFWEEKAAGGVSLAQIQEGFMNSAEYKEKSLLSQLPKFDVGTNFVPEDMPAIIHKGERIIPAADNAELMRREKEGDKESSSASNDKVVAKIEQLIQVVMTGDVANAQKTNDLYKLIRDWDGRGMPPVRDEEE